MTACDWLPSCEPRRFTGLAAQRLAAASVGFQRQSSAAEGSASWERCSASVAALMLTATLH